MRKFAILFLAAAGICGPFAANVASAQNTSPVISVSGATLLPNNLSHQVAHLKGEVTILQQQVQSILQQPIVTAQEPPRLYPDPLNG